MISDCSSIFEKFRLRSNVFSGILDTGSKSKLLPLERGRRMRHKSVELMNEIQSFVETYYINNRHSPSTTEIAEAVGIARGTAYKYLVDMAERGMIKYDGQQIVTEKTSKVNAELTSVAILGSVACGIPQLEEENAEEYLSLPVALFGSGTFYLLRAKGTSMIEAGINPGDLVLVRKQSTAKNGEIVVALVNNENTLKRLYVDQEHNCVRLHPENKDMDDIIVSEGEELQIQGVAVHVIKALT
jgi:repressor LexA